jgi:alkylation response protein AidB-like acyl-CoA dehydrogenase
MQAVTAATVVHLKNRKQFGQPLAGFQVLQHRLVDMRLCEAESTAHLRSVARSHDEHDGDLDLQLLRLRIQISRAARHVTQDGIQLHGGMGMTEELPAGAFYKRALALRVGSLRPHDAEDELLRMRNAPGC